MDERALADLVVSVAERSGETYARAARALDYVARRDLGMLSSRDLVRSGPLPATTRLRIVELAVTRIRGRA